MCESKVFLIRDGREELLMEDVTRIEIEGDKLKIYGILGEKKELEGKVVLMDLIGHKIVLEG
ncbi:MAG: CooT family nickel-binding protein [Archaeoglobaceae archaeon]|nr:CooT family nickel-binding protein [Archaeoglobaceae archaeon]